MIILHGLVWFNSYIRKNVKKCREHLSLSRYSVGKKGRLSMIIRIILFVWCVCLVVVYFFNFVCLFVFVCVFLFVGWFFLWGGCGLWVGILPVTFDSEKKPVKTCWILKLKNILQVVKQKEDIKLELIYYRGAFM